MDDPRYPADLRLSAVDAMNKRDKRRVTILLRLQKMSHTFEVERDGYYRLMLHELQSTLLTLHGGTNDEYMEQVHDFEEERDYELVRLKLWEDYQVMCAEREYKQDLMAARLEYNLMVKLVTETLHANLQKKILALKENKIMLDLFNSLSLHLLSLFMANLIANLLFDRRLLRKRDAPGHSGGSGSHPQGSYSAYQLSLLGDIDEHSDSGYTLLNKRRRGGATGGDGESGSGRELGSHALHGRATVGPRLHPDLAGGHSSAEELGAGNGHASDSGYELLSNLIFGLLLLLRNKPQTRHNARPGDKLTSLKLEEVDSDLLAMRLAAKPPKV